jgi:DNA polymerase III epsilon subunit-like protein
MHAVVSLDFEATGLRTQNAHIIQIGACCDIDGKRFEFEELCCPTVPVSDKICSITGLAREDINKARSVREVIEAFVVFLQSLPAMNITLVAYNGHRYDFPLFYWNCSKYGLNYMNIIRRCNIVYLGDPLLWLKTSLKTEHMVRSRSGRPSYKLGDVYECMYHRRFQDAHTALADAAAVLDIINDPQHVKESFIVTPSEYIQEAARVTEGLTTKLKTKSKKSVREPSMMCTPSKIVTFLRGTF